MRVAKARFNPRLLFVTACALAAQDDPRVAPPAVRVNIDGGFPGEPDNEQVRHLSIGPWRYRRLKIGGCGWCVFEPPTARAG